MKLTNNLYFYPEKGMFDCNTYVIRGDRSIIIDPGSTQFLPELVQDLNKDGINPEDIDIITNTHLHGDHCWANEDFKKTSEARIIIHPLQKQFYDITVIETTKFFGLQPVGFKEDSCFSNNRLDSEGVELELIHSPGHSPDSICFYISQDRMLICGDVIFNGNTGRVDLPGGNAAELIESIGKLSRLQIDYLLPGHMDLVTGSEPIERNFEFINKNVLAWL